jgi:hypothetical protein
MADSSMFSVKTFQLRKIQKIAKDVLHIILNVLSNETDCIFIDISFTIKVVLTYSAHGCSFLNGQQSYTVFLGFNHVMFSILLRWGSIIQVGVKHSTEVNLNNKDTKWLPTHLM